MSTLGHTICSGSPDSICASILSLDRLLVMLALGPNLVHQASQLSELITVRRCRRFLRTTLKSVWMTYARRVGLLAMTFPFPFLFILSADLTSHELSLHVSRQSTEGIDTLINLQC